MNFDYKVYVIENDEQFNNIYSIFKNDSRIGSVPERFLIGFDTEYISLNNYPIENVWVKNNYKNIVTCCIQLCSKNICLVIDLKKFNFNLPNKLIKIISSGSWVKVGVGIELDLKYLSHNYNLDQCCGSIELQNVALIMKCPKTNLQDLFNYFNNTNISKNNIFDWSGELSNEKITYAANDAIMSLNVFNHITQNFMPLDTFKNDIIKLEICSKNNTTNINYVGKLNEIYQKENCDPPKYTYTKIDEQRFKVECKFKNIDYSIQGVNCKNLKQKVAEYIYSMLN